MPENPFRLFKHWVHEDGIATPPVAWWPRLIKRAAPGLSFVAGHWCILLVYHVDAS